MLDKPNIDYHTPKNKEKRMAKEQLENILTTGARSRRYQERERTVERSCMYLRVLANAQYAFLSNKD